MEKSKTSIIWKTSNRRAKLSEIWDSSGSIYIYIYIYLSGYERDLRVRHVITVYIVIGA